MKIEAYIHPCPTATERELAHTIVSMVPRLGVTELIELEQRLQRSVRDHRIIYGQEGGTLALYLSGRSFITFTKQG